MMRRSPRRLWLCATLVILNLAFIWGNSAMPGTVSGAISQWVSDVLNLFLKLPAGDMQEGEHVLRKLAHFSEFALLGVWLRWLWGMLGERPLERVALPLLCGLLAACCDETIQRFVEGRFSSLLDVWIDTAGVTLGILLLHGIHAWKEKRRK